MIWFFYYFFVCLMVAGIGMAALWSPKSAKWIRGRHTLFRQVRQMPPKTSARIWFHVSSLGEFEQARPVMEKIKAARPDIEIILSFFSPSGYEVRSDYPLATVFYLPADLPGNAGRWLDLVRPDLAVFVKYDLWPGYLRALGKRGIPSVLISAYWTAEAGWASWNIPPARSLLRKMKKIFLQQSVDLARFQQKGFTNLELSGDTRIDRVMTLPSEADLHIPPVLRQSGIFDIVAGSTWPADEDILFHAIASLQLRAIIAPHDVSEKNIRRLMAALPFPAQKLSSIAGSGSLSPVIIIDLIGLLPYLYSLGKAAYVGGGFGAGIHNTLEPMAHGKAVLFGPACRKFPEAVAMVHEQGAWAVSDKNELTATLRRLLYTEGEAEKAGGINLRYLRRHAGASERITQYLLDMLSLGR